MRDIIKKLRSLANKRQSSEGTTSALQNNAQNIGDRRPVASEHPYWSKSAQNQDQLAGPEVPNIKPHDNCYNWRSNGCGESSMVANDERFGPTSSMRKGELVPVVRPLPSPSVSSLFSLNSYPASAASRNDLLSTMNRLKANPQDRSDGFTDCIPSSRFETEFRSTADKRTMEEYHPTSSDGVPNRRNGPGPSRSHVPSSNDICANNKFRPMSSSGVSNAEREFKSFLKYCKSSEDPPLSNDEAYRVDRPETKERLSIDAFQRLVSEKEGELVLLKDLCAQKKALSSLACASACHFGRSKVEYDDRLRHLKTERSTLELSLKAVNSQIDDTEFRQRSLLTVEDRLKSACESLSEMERILTPLVVDSMATLTNEQENLSVSSSSSTSVCSQLDDDEEPRYRLNVVLASPRSPPRPPIRQQQRVRFLPEPSNRVPVYDDISGEVKGAFAKYYDQLNGVCRESGAWVE